MAGASLDDQGCLQENEMLCKKNDKNASSAFSTKKELGPWKKKEGNCQVKVTSHAWSMLKTQRVNSWGKGCQLCGARPGQGQPLHCARQPLPCVNGGPHSQVFLSFKGVRNWKTLYLKMLETNLKILFNYCTGQTKYVCGLCLVHELPF